MNTNDTELLGYIGGLFGLPEEVLLTSPLPASVDSAKALVPLYRNLNTPAVALIAALFLLGLLTSISGRRVREDVFCAIRSCLQRVHKAT